MIPHTQQIPRSMVDTRGVGSLRGSCMAKLLCAILLFTQISLQQDPSPESTDGFCRRFAHQSCVIDRRLYLDGGMVNYHTGHDDNNNITNQWLLYNDLDSVTAQNDFPQIKATLSKNVSIPDVSGGILWADSVNKRFYLFGGEYTNGRPNSPNLLAYDVLNNQWDSFGPPSNGIQSVSWGGGVAIPELGMAYILGGWLNNNTVPSWSGPPFATSGLVQYNMDHKTWTNNSGPDTTPRVEGVMTYLPAGDNGLLVYFGGFSVFDNGTANPSPMTNIYIYDIVSTKWYTQTASGDIPAARKRFCAGTAWAADQSSYNIYLYGGLGFGTNSSGFDDVYILTIPSFKWLRWWQGDSADPKPHHSLTCNVVGGQMLIVGGNFPLKPPEQFCDSPATWGTHNLDLGKQSGSMWAKYKANLTSYVVPSEIIAAVGGSPQGGATIRAPVGGFNNTDLATYFSRKAEIAVRTPTRSIPSPTSTSSTIPVPPSTVRKLSTGAIAGIAVAGTVVLIALVFGIIFLRRKPRHEANSPKFPVFQQPPSYPQSPVSPYSTTVSSPQPMSYQQAPYQPPAELAANGNRARY